MFVRFKTVACPLHNPDDGIVYECGSRFCGFHAEQIVTPGLHEGQRRAGDPPLLVLPATQEREDVGTGRPERGGEGAAAALAYTAAATLGGPKVYPPIDREGMGVYYDAAQLSDTVKDMRMLKMKNVRLPHISIEDNEMPPGHVHETASDTSPV